MKKFSRLSVSGSLLVIACVALATTVIPPSFDDLVGRAEMIFQGTVTDVRSEWTGEGAPLSDVTQLGKNEAAASAGRPISAQELKQAIHTKAQAQSEHAGH